MAQMVILFYSIGFLLQVRHLVLGLFTKDRSALFFREAVVPKVNSRGTHENPQDPAVLQPLVEASWVVAGGGASRIDMGYPPC